MKKILLGLTAALAFAAIHAQAQGPQRRHQQELDETRSLLDQVMTARLTRELDLDDGAMIHLVRKVGVHRERMRGLSNQRNELMRELRQSSQREDGGNASATLDTVLSIEEQLTAERLAFHEAISQDLTPAQHVKVFLFLHDFDAEMRQLIDQARQRSNERGPASGGQRPRRAPDNGDAETNEGAKDARSAPTQ